MTTEIMQFTTFVVGAHLCGVNVQQVQEILHFQKITPVALTPAYVRGLMNLRGNIVTVLDLRRLFELPPRPDETTGMHLVVQPGDEAISLLVDRMHTIIEVSPDHLLPPPGTAQGVIARYIQHVCQVNDELVMLLDLEAIVRLQDAELLPNPSQTG